MQKKIKPPWKPYLRDYLDTQNFDGEFTSMVAEDSLAAGGRVTQSVQDKFQGFTYVGAAPI